MKIDSQDYKNYLKPKVANVLGAINLNKTYFKGVGDYLFYKNNTKENKKVLDMVGGFGSTILGHNNPEIVEALTSALSDNVPVMAQGSIRSDAGYLSKSLATLMRQRTSKEWVVTLTNSGAECVEAAIKHAMFQQQIRINKIVHEQTLSIRKYLQSADRVRKLPCTILKEYYSDIDDLEALSIDELACHFRKEISCKLHCNLHLVSLEGGFHGKTSGALKITHYSQFRQPWSEYGVSSSFLPINDTKAFTAHIENTTISIPVLDIADNLCSSISWSPVIACVVEPIQGEGGIQIIDKEFMQCAEHTLQNNKVPLIVDEIQSGMGRTGSLLASDKTGVYGDFVLLSKSLGGGLVKIGAMITEKSQYVDDFGYLHSSTFAEDSHSAIVANKVLEVIQRNDSELIKRCSEMGEYIQVKLNHLKRKYPEILKEVRGVGLMVGIEFYELHRATSPLAIEISKQNVFGYVISSYMLNKFDIRVAPTISQPNTLRLEPSALISESDIDRFVKALQIVLDEISKNNWHELYSIVFDYHATPLTEGYEKPVNRSVDDYDIIRNNTPSGVARKVNRKKVACIAHFIEAEDITHWDPTLGALCSRQAEELLEKAYSVIEPFATQNLILVNPEGQEIELQIFGIPLSSNAIANKVKTKQTQEIIDTISETVEAARLWGAEVVGFAGYTSIVTNNCLLLDFPDLHLTSGNSLTAAASIDSMQQVLQKHNKEASGCVLGVVGALGNIGQVITLILAGEVGSVVLFGRIGSEKRLKRFASKLRDSVNSCYVSIETDLDMLRKCDLILSASNAASPIIHGHMLGTQQTVICDIAVPGDVDVSSLENRKNVTVIRGGLIRLPKGNDVTLLGSGLKPREVWACVAEVMLLGFSGDARDDSIGMLKEEGVRHTLASARSHGFDLMPKIQQMAI